VELWETFPWEKKSTKSVSGERGHENCAGEGPSRRKAVNHNLKEERGEETNHNKVAKKEGTGEKERATKDGKKANATSNENRRRKRRGWGEKNRKRPEGPETSPNREGRRQEKKAKEKKPRKHSQQRPVTSPNLE